MMRARASGCTVAYLAQGACRAPKTGGARRTEPLKAATRSSTFAHAHKGRGMRCSSTPKSAGPAGRRALREARAAPDCALAGLLDSLRALDCASFTPQCRHRLLASRSSNTGCHQCGEAEGRCRGGTCRRWCWCRWPALASSEGRGGAAAGGRHLQLGQSHGPAFGSGECRCFQNRQQLFGLLTEFRVAAASQQPAGGDGLTVVALPHPGGDHQQPDPGSMGIRKRMGLRHRGQQLQALAVIAPFQCCFGGAQIQRFNRRAHQSAASHHHRADARIGEHLQQ